MSLERTNQRLAKENQSLKDYLSSAQKLLGRIRLDSPMKRSDLLSDYGSLAQSQTGTEVGVVTLNLRQDGQQPHRRMQSQSQFSKQRSPGRPNPTIYGTQAQQADTSVPNSCREKENFGV